jgi:hypothetical protein
VISASQDLKNIFYNNTNVEIGTGCYIEYNMNEMIDAISAENNIADSVYTSQIIGYYGDAWTLPNPYKKLFPVDSIIKPFRPTSSGIKYYLIINGDTPVDTISPARTVQYPTNQPRLYYPGVETFYKYWLTPKNTGVNIKINYAATGTLYALTNKINLKFEKNHSLPSTYTVVIKKSDDTEITIGPNPTPASGNVVLYLSGDVWYYTETDPEKNTYVAFDTPIAIKSISLTTPSAGTTKVIGVIELSAKWIKDISADVVNFDISKESSSSSEDILPVGKITSDSLSINLSKYNETSLEYKSYNKTEALNSSKNYMVKNGKLFPYFKIYHSNGAITEGLKKYDKVVQGHYYLDSWSISDYGDVSATALDSSKYLMETIAPDMLCEYYPATAIIRRLLDSIGFSNYNFNLISDTDPSIPVINYFWTDGSKTVWDHLQELCRDIQMNAIMDENNILQFYSRDKMYSQTTKNWEFYYDQKDNKLPNISSFSQKDIASANEVKVIWSTPISSSYLGSSGPLWQAPTSFLIAGGLKTELTPTSDTVVIDLQTPDKYSRFQSGFNFNGYFLVDSEIIEFDAIGYQYTPKDLTPSTIYDVLKKVNITNNAKDPINIWIENGNDLAKYRNLCKQSIQSNGSDTYLKPNGTYRVKTRGALGTTAAKHNASGTAVQKYAWTGAMITQNA